MRTKYFFSFVTFLFVSVFAIAQTAQKQTVKVWGNCGMCKKTIEKAAKQAGATTADWNTKTKILSVSYTDNQMELSAIEKAVAAAGYDTKNFTASDEAYKKLHSCCQYERKGNASTGKESKCEDNDAAGKDKNCKDKKECTDKKML